MKPIYIIAACSENRVIGKNGKLPWDIPEDAAYWREKVLGGIMIEGRRCFEELGGALPGVETIVLSRDPAFAPQGVLTAVSLPLALNLAQTIPGTGPIWICGGYAVYKEALPLAQKLFLTMIHTQIDGDTYFPEWETYFSVKLVERDSFNKHFSYTFYIFGTAEASNTTH